MLQQLKNSNFKFVTNSTESDCKRILLRHDVDYDLNSALIMAEKEHEMGVKAVYLVRIENELINVLSRTNFECLRRIASLNHEIGIHYEYGTSLLNVESCIEIMTHLLGKEPTHISFHKPTKFALPDTKTSLLIDLNSQEYIIDFKYISDSGMKWRQNLEDVIETENSIHLLIHPEFWVQNKKVGYKRVLKKIERRIRYEIAKNVKLEIHDITNSIKKRESVDTVIYTAMQKRNQ